MQRIVVPYLRIIQTVQENKCIVESRRQRGLCGGSNKGSVPQRRAVLTVCVIFFLSFFFFSQLHRFVVVSVPSGYTTANTDSVSVYLFLPLPPVFAFSVHSWNRM